MTIPRTWNEVAYKAAVKRLRDHRRALESMMNAPKIVRAQKNLKVLRGIVDTMREADTDYKARIIEALRNNGYNITLAAAVLGIQRATLKIYIDRLRAEGVVIPKGIRRKPTFQTFGGKKWTGRPTEFPVAKVRAAVLACAGHYGQAATLLGCRRGTVGDVLKGRNVKAVGRPEEFTADDIRKALAACNGKPRAAAKMLGCTANTVYRKMREAA
jgi:DNA-binding NtrC family response regulator